MKAFFLSLLMIVMLSPIGVRAADRAPSGYVVEMALAGLDAGTKTAIVRDGKEIAAKLMMPVFDGDVVFVRDPESSVTLEFSGGKHVKVDRENMRFTVKGEMASSDDNWNILTAIAGVFAGEGDQAPENMVAKGDAPKVPAAVRGSNFITPRNSLDLAWSGGKAPYALSLVIDGKEKVLAENIAGASATNVIGEGDKPLTGKFTIVLLDAAGQTVQIRFRTAETLPRGGPRSGSSAAGLLVTAAWLTSLKDGAWSLEALQMLGQAKAAETQVLADRIAAGWRYKE